MKRAKFEKMMDQSGELATLPVVAQKVLEVVHCDRADARGLQQIIVVDPVLAARVLRLANSAYYRPSGVSEIADLRRAIVVLGFVNIRNLAVTTCLHSLYAREFRTNHFSARDLWVHSVETAVLARLLARRCVPAQADEAFLAGIIHDVGMVVAWNLLPERYPQVLVRYHGTSQEFIRCEREVLGFDHCAAGSAMLRRWGLPAELRRTVAHHHELKRTTAPDAFLSAVVYAADRICADRGKGFFDQTPDRSTPAPLLVEAGLVGAEYDAFLEQCEPELQAAREVLLL